MKDQLARLRELQEIDLRLDTLENAKKEILDRLDVNRGFLDKLVEDLDAQKNELQEIRELQKSKKEDLKDVREQHDKRKKRLTNIGSTKEFNAVEKELEVIKKQVEQTEEEILHLEEVIGTTESSISEKEEKIVQLRESIAQDHSEAETEIAAYDEKIDALKARQDEAREEVSKRVMYKYDFIRSRRPGNAIVAAKDGHCEGCFMALPPQDFIEIQRGESLITCPSCQRILYHWEAFEGEEPKVEGEEAAAS